MTDKELNEIIKRHQHWLNKDCEEWEDMRANLCGADLQGKNLANVDLTMANLAGANLEKTNLFHANLDITNLDTANLKYANLSYTSLKYANLMCANLSFADLFHADFEGAKVKGTIFNKSRLDGVTNFYRLIDLAEIRIDDKTLNKYFPLVCPSEGAFIGWKKVNNNYIVKLQIPEDAKRSSAFERKCRCNKATVLAIETEDGKDSGVTSINSLFYSDFIYEIGKTVEIKNFCEDRKIECAEGIHFFITRDEAVNF